MAGHSTKTNAERFWSLVNGPWVDERLDPYEDCWKWMGGTCTSRRPKSLPANKPWKRYGRFHWPLPGFPKHLINAHRAALLLAKGEPPTDHHVAGHHCDEPLCVHPGHLEWQTQQENVQEAIDRGRLQKVLRPHGGGLRYASTGVYQ